MANDRRAIAQSLILYRAKKRIITPRAQPSQKHMTCQMIIYMFMALKGFVRSLVAVDLQHPKLKTVDLLMVQLLK
jgi:hypothetical protein